MSFDLHSGFTYLDRIKTALGMPVEALMWKNLAKNLHTLYRDLMARELLHIYPGTSRPLLTINASSSLPLTTSPGTSLAYCVHQQNVVLREGVTSGKWSLRGKDINYEIWVSDKAWTTHTKVASGTITGTAASVGGSAAFTGYPNSIISLFVGRYSGASAAGELYYCRVHEYQATTLPASP